MKKRVFSLLMALLIIMSLSVTAFADGGYEGSYVIDKAGILTEEQANSLEAMAAESSESSGCGIYLVIVDDYRQYTGESFDGDAAEKIYEDRSFGLGDDKSGIMLMMSMDDRHMYLLSHGLGSIALSDSENEDLRDDIKKYFKDDEWYQGFCEYIKKAAGNVYLDSSRSSDHEYDSPIFRSYKLKSRLLGIGVCLVIGLVAAFAVVMVLRAQLRSVAKETDAGRYADKGGLNLSRHYDRFTHRSRSRVYDPPAKSNNSSSSGSSGGYSGGGSDF